MGSSERAATTRTEDLEWLHESVETVSFWTAILLPVVYVPLFVVDVDGAVRIGLFACLVVLHLVVLAVGHTHGQ